MRGAPRRWLADAAAAFASVVRNADLRRLELAVAGSVLAYWAYGILVAIYAYREGGASAVGVLGLVRMLPSALAAPATAALADRLRRERVLLAAALVRGACAAATVAAVWADGPLAAVFVLAAAVQIASTAAFAAKAALTPSLARDTVELTAANVVSATIEGVGNFIGPGLAGLVLAAAGLEAALGAVAAAFVVSALLIARIQVRAEPRPARARVGLADELLGGVRAVRRTPGLPLLVGLWGAQTFVAGLLNVLIVVLALELLALDEPAVGYLDGVIGLGGLAGMLVVLARAGRAARGGEFAIGLVLWGVPLALIAVWPELVWVLILLAVVGVGNTLVDVAGVTLIQHHAPDEALGRVFGVVESLTWATIGLGGAVAPLLIAGLGDRGALAATGVILPVLAVVTWRRLISLGLPDRARELEVLRGVPLLASLAPETLELLAARLVPVRAAAGSEIVRQGAVGDRFYVVESGEAAVSVDGAPAGTLRSGDFFGEISLLHDVPRTATVSAVTDVSAWAVERADFLAALNGSAVTREAAEWVAHVRLRSLRPASASL